MRSVTIASIIVGLISGSGCIGILSSCSAVPFSFSALLNSQAESPPAASPEVSSPPTPSSPVAALARQITVRILTEPGAGSGILIHHRGTTYTVLTCHHVIAASAAEQYSILTPDGAIHPARLLPMSTGKDLDLAFLAFESNTTYHTVTLGDSDRLTIGSPVYASGFPNYRFFEDQTLVENTQDLGTGAYQLTTGELSMRLDRSLSGGYRLGYTNEIEQGMSGGPVLNLNGQLVGVNGRLKHPLQGINAYTFTDGTLPSERLFEQMESLSWAIPAASFQAAVNEMLRKK